MELNWRNLAAWVGMGICLLALICSPPVGVALAAALVLAPVLLFGLIIVPRSLWPSADLELSFAAPIFERAELFQRPPPFSLR
jgi:hypothetical protein